MRSNERYILIAALSCKRSLNGCCDEGNLKDITSRLDIYSRILNVNMLLLHSALQPLTQYPFSKVYSNQARSTKISFALHYPLVF
jgi:hypothetical protein